MDIKRSILAQLKPLAEMDSQTLWDTLLSRLFDATPTRIKKNIVSPFLSEEKVQSTKCELPSQVSLGEYDSWRCCCINTYHLCTTFLIDFDVSGAGGPEDLNTAIIKQLVCMTLRVPMICLCTIVIVYLTCCRCYMSSNMPSITVMFVLAMNTI